MKKILLAHLKKPPFETRIFDKIAKSLNDSGKFKISIIGNSIRADSTFHTPENIQLFPVFQSKAHSSHLVTDLTRFHTILYFQIPDLVVVCSPELLAQAVIYCCIMKKTLVLDLQENYPLNYTHQIAYRWPYNKLLRLIASTYLSVLIPFVKKVWMAERVYTDQIRVDCSSVIENRVPSFWQTTNCNPIFTASDYFLFSGYITEESGVLKALDFFIEFKAAFPEMELIIVGYCPSEKLKIKLKSIRDLHQGIRLIGLDTWVMSDTIFKLLKSAKAVLMPYFESKANLGKIPTKLFEAASLRVPVILPLQSQFTSSAYELKIPVIEANFSLPEQNDFMRINSEILANQKEILCAESGSTFDSCKIITEIQYLISDS